MSKTKFFCLFFFLASFAPNQAAALRIQDFMSGENGNGITSEAYLVTDRFSGQVLLKRESAKPWPPASLTKLITALVVLDYNPKLEKNISLIKADEVGGARLYSKAGATYKIKDLFYAALVASANNAANAIARSTGLPRREFVAEMNKKARELGAQNSWFADPSGIGEKSYTTAEDFVKIAQEAFTRPEIVKAAQLSEYAFRSADKRYRHKLKNTNKLLGTELNVIAGKTGFLELSRYNFAGLVMDQPGQENIVVLLGAQSREAQFREAKQLAQLVGLAKSLYSMGGMVLGEKIINP